MKISKDPRDYMLMIVEHELSSILVGFGPLESHVGLSRPSLTSMQQGVTLSQKLRAILDLKSQG